mmetsp:Transcript_28534/g.51561  ORF Transcript_28534/g.51561 Transcript_28534/m.51561 type:complete len:303 (-) Transcript_28534:254-1162(-)
MYSGNMNCQKVCCSRPLLWRQKPAVSTMLILLVFVVSSAYCFRPPHLRDPVRPRINAADHIHTIRAPELLQLSATSTKVTKTDAEWKRDLNPEAYNVLRKEGTEPANSSRLNDIKAGTDEGTFTCAGCGSPLFLASTKFDSGTGWPSFYSPLDGRAVDLSVDYKLIVPRTEVQCSTCQGHLGHVFDDGPKPTGKRYCLNGVAMRFVRDGANPELTKEVSERVVEGGDAVVVKQPLSAVLPMAAFDGILAALFLGTFVQRTAGGDLVGVDAGFRAIFQLFPLVVGAFYANSAVQKILPAFVDE